METSLDRDSGFVWTDGVVGFAPLGCVDGEQQGLAFTLTQSPRILLIRSLASLQRVLLELKYLQAFLDMSVLMKQAPDELGGVIFEHQQD